MTETQSNNRLDSSPAETAQNVDFSQALEHAAQHAPLAKLTSSEQSVQDQLKHNDKLVSPVRDLPDEALVFAGGNRDNPNQVTTRDPVAYAVLLKQAVKLVSPRKSHKEIEGQVEGIQAHELEHAAGLHTVSPDSPLRYGVTIFRVRKGDHEEVLGFHPFVTPEGYLRKIDLAYMIAAPTELSESDQHLLKHLGYNSPEEVLSRARVSRDTIENIGSSAMET